MTPKWITFRKKNDVRGALVAIEGGSDVPFEIKRVYALHGLATGSVRGGHTHKKLVQVIVCLSGSCLVELDDGRAVQIVKLDDPARGLLLEPMVWHEMRGFSEGCVLMVLAADHYDEEDYIREHGVFLKLTRESCR